MIWNTQCVCIPAVDIRGRSISLPRIKQLTRLMQITALLRSIVAAFAELLLPRVVSGGYPFAEQPVGRWPHSSRALSLRTVAECRGTSPDPSLVSIASRSTWIRSGTIRTLKTRSQIDSKASKSLSWCSCDVFVSNISKRPLTRSRTSSGLSLSGPLSSAVRGSLVDARRCGRSV